MTLTDKATAKSSHNGQFLVAENSSVPSLVVAGFPGNFCSSLLPCAIEELKNR
jgi:hypothetical protein